MDIQGIKIKKNERNFEIDEETGEEVTNLYLLKKILNELIKLNSK